MKRAKVTLSKEHVRKLMDGDEVTIRFAESEVVLSVDPSVRAVDFHNLFEQIFGRGF